MEKHRPHQQDIEQELTELSPLLAQLRPKLNEPTAPEGYFETLDERVIAKANEPTLAATPMPMRVVSSHAYRLTGRQMWLGIAASLALLVVVAAGWLRNRAQPTHDFSAMTQQAAQTPSVAMLETDEIKNYVRANVRDLDAQQRLEHQQTLANINDDTASTPQKNNNLNEVAAPSKITPNALPKPEKTNFDPTQLSDEELEQYLQEHADEIDIL